MVQSPKFVHGVSPGVGVNSLAVSICMCSVVHDMETFGGPDDGGLLRVDTSHDAMQNLDRRSCIGKAWCVSSDVDCDAKSISGCRFAFINAYLKMYLLAFASRVERSCAVVASKVVLNVRRHAVNAIK
jgi:phosphoglucomutase